MFYYLQAMRPKQWIKNLFVFPGLIFSKNVFHAPMLLLVIATFFIFSLLSSAVYLINDIADRERDQQHPQKKHRPLAAGKISLKGTILLAIFLTLLSLGSAFALSLPLGLLASLYFILMLLYTFYLKHCILLDVFTIAAGFVIRVAAGTEVLGIYLSPWLLICTGFLALFMALGKRRNELKLLGLQAQTHRQTLDAYTLPLLDQMIAIVTAATIVTYSLYTTFQFQQTMTAIATIPFVLYGLFRYLYLIYTTDAGGSPEEIVLKDRPLQVDILLWIAISIMLLY